ncbi:hypothetical protein IJJ97_05935 [bacterium]|nr:hypothetical protein [bacterium]
MEKKEKKVYMARIGNIAFKVDENFDQATLNTVTGNIQLLITRKIQKARNYLRKLDKELMDIEQGNFTSGELY